MRTHIPHAAGPTVHTRAWNTNVEGIVVMTAIWHMLLAANTACIHAFSFVDFAFPLLDSVGQSAIRFPLIQLWWDRERDCIWRKILVLRRWLGLPRSSDHTVGYFNNLLSINCLATLLYHLSGFSSQPSLVMVWSCTFTWHWILLCCSL